MGVTVRDGELFFLGGFPKEAESVFGILRCFSQNSFQSSFPTFPYAGPRADPDLLT